MLKKIKKISFLKISLLIILIASFSLIVNQPNAHAAGASFFLSPGAKTVPIGGKFSVGVKLNTGGQIINTVDGTINFDKNLLEVLSVSTGGSLVNLWITQPSFSNSAGTVSFSGGVTPPGYNGTAGHICTISFKAKKAGGASVRFSSGAILANDGKGTNILASMGSASYKISPKVDAPKSNDTPSKKTEPKEIEVDYNKPVVKSETHPDSNVWYKEKEVKFTWELPESIIGVSVDFNQLPISDPGPKADGLFNEKEYEAEKGGLWYLHIKFKDNKKWGTISHYKIMIDDIAPSLSEVKINDEEAGEWPELSFKVKDSDSGIDGVEVVINSTEEVKYKLEADVSKLKLENLEVGKYTAVVIVSDKAGNKTIETIEFEIRAIVAPKIIKYSGNIKPSDDFFVSGTTEEDYLVEVYIADSGNNEIVKEVVQPDIAGNWFYIYDGDLEKGRYTVWVRAQNKNELNSVPSERVSFIVSPPIFIEIGTFIIDYFTVLVSLLFMIILVIASVMYIIFFLRRKLKKETIEIEDALKNNLEKYQKIIDQEFAKLAKFEGTPEYKKKKQMMKAGLKKKIASIEQQILKEVLDVEKILK
ncbi:hypothetical protein KAI92_03350 [Candidatus Parcubacteria bacterium]|nr:hypothetical protein [Candidatus Parcubacteria bacterium]